MTAATEIVSVVVVIEVALMDNDNEMEGIKKERNCAAVTVVNK